MFEGIGDASFYKLDDRDIFLLLFSIFIVKGFYNFSVFDFLLEICKVLLLLLNTSGMLFWD